MALSFLVFEVGETLVDEAAADERREAEGVTTSAFAGRDLHADALPCFGDSLGNLPEALADA